MTAALRTRFQPIDNAITARGKMLALKQGTGAGSAAEYVSAFRRLIVAVPDMSEGDRLFQFMRGLQTHLSTHCRVQGVETLDAAELLVVRVGAVSHSSPAPASSSSSAAASHAPMQLDAIEGLEHETDGADPRDAVITQMNTHPRKMTPTTESNFQT